MVPQASGTISPPQGSNSPVLGTHSQPEPQSRLIETSTTRSPLSQAEPLRAPDQNLTDHFFPASPQEQVVLLYIAQQEAQSDDPTKGTRWITYNELAAELATTTATAKKLVFKLRRLQLIRETEISRGRYSKGKRYQIINPNTTVLALSVNWNLRNDSTGTSYGNRRRLIQNLQTEPQNVVVSSIYNNTTDNKKAGSEIDEALKETLDRAGLTEFLIGLSDVLPLYRKFVLSGELSFEEFKAGLFHLGFYLGSPEHSEGIDKPKTWAISQLKKNGGYYPEPASYISPEEAREQAILKDKMKKLQRLKQIKHQQFNLDYQLWVSELPEPEKRRLAGVASPSGRVAEEALKEAFRAQREEVV
ncbi:MAG: hypothetical protein VYA34_02655 [Myxococcota bacterium]|nr:hypothetical protein [Myxococcota bacterium]